MTMGFEKKGIFTGVDYVSLNITYHSYTYNKKYNTFWRSLALQPSPCLGQGSKELKGGYKIKN